MAVRRADSDTGLAGDAFERDGAFGGGESVPGGLEEPVPVAQCVRAGARACSLAVMTALRDEGKIGAIGLSSVTLDGLRRALPAGIACVQNAYSLVSRGDEEILRLCVRERIAWVPFFPLGSAFPGMPKVTDEPAVTAVARSLGRTPSQVGLAWLLHHAPNTLLIPGTADPGHLEADIAAATVEFDDAALAALDAVESRPADLTLG